MGGSLRNGRCGDLRFGIAYVPERMVEASIASGALQIVLDDLLRPFDGCFLYHPSRRQNLLAFQIVVDALRRRGK